MSENLFFNILYGLYFLSLLTCAFTLFAKKRRVRLLGRGALGASLIWHTVVVVERWVQAGRPPMSNMFETMVFFAWCVVLVYLVVDIRYNIPLLAAPTALVALLSLGFATLVFPDTIEPLRPALQNSFWLTTHVSLCLVGYAAFAIAYLMSLFSLVWRRDWHHWAGCYVAALSLAAMGAGVVGVKLEGIDLSLSLKTSAIFIVSCSFAAALLTPLLSALVRIMRLKSDLFQDSDPSRARTPDPSNTQLQASPRRPGETDLPGKVTQLQKSVVETVMHQTIVLGFLFLSAGIITGSVWAQRAWGRYWGWDPKETWSLITWLIYGIYLHLRFGWKKKNAWVTWFAILGFWAVVFTYFGVNYLLTGLHSYT